MKQVDKLNQDEYSLSRPTFPTPKGGTLTVVGWKGKSGYNKKYVVKCNICSQDPEMFGDGTFSMVKGSLTQGSVPCGCASNPRWTENQNRVRVSREAGDRGLKYLGWSFEYNGKNTKLLLSCPLHGNWASTSIDNFLRGRGCPACRADKAGEINLKEDSTHANAFIATGVFTEGTKFWRSKRKTKAGVAAYWYYSCPKCSHDEYVKHGLCSGVFESCVSDLKRGIVSCRCSKSYRWIPEQREYQLNKEMERRRDNNLADYTFVGWKEEYKNNYSKFKYLCKEHGEQTISVASFLSGCGCPECKGKTQRQAYINVVTDGDIPIALKLGIANEPTCRLKVQNYKNLFQMHNVGIWEFPTVKACREAENECKSKLTCGVLNDQDLRDGWTETTSIKNLEAVIGIYTKHGGIRIPS